MELSKLKELLNYEIVSTISLDELSLLMVQLSLLIESNVPIVDSLALLENNKNVSVEKLINRVKSKVERGIAFSDAIKEEKFDSSDLLSAMISSGELTGELSNIFDFMAKFYERKSKNRKEIRAALIYPIILMVVSILVIIFTALMVLPTYIDLFKARNLDLPLITKIFVAFTSFISKYFFVILFVLTLIVLLFYLLYTKNSSFKYQIDRISIKLPIIKRNNLYFLYSYSSYCISILNKSKVPMLDIIDIITMGTNNLFFRERLVNISYSLEKGEELNKSFKKENIFSDLYITMLKAGEESGNLSRIMLKTGEYYNNRFLDSLKYMSRLLEPIIILIMALIVGLIVFSIAMPMFNLVNLI